jgi:hypothetical protein
MIPMQRVVFLAESWSGRNPRAARARPKGAPLGIDSAVVARLVEENSTPDVRGRASQT